MQDNNEYWKSASFKFVTISQTGILNTVRTTNTGTVHKEITIEGYQYCPSCRRAFEGLISESYTNFILTVRCIAVATYCNSNMGLKIFDPHARDLYGRGQPQSTCVLLKVHVFFSKYRTAYKQNEDT